MKPIWWNGRYAAHLRGPSFYPWLPPKWLIHQHAQHSPKAFTFGKYRSFRMFFFARFYMNKNSHVDSSNIARIFLFNTSNPIGILAHLLRMVSWNLSTMRFGGDLTSQSSSENMIGCLGQVRSTEVLPNESLEYVSLGSYPIWPPPGCHRHQQEFSYMFW